MVYVLLSLIIGAVGLLLFYLHNVYKYWEKRNVPFEKPEFLIGNMKGIGKTVHFRDINKRIYDRFKGTAPIAGLYFGISKSVMIMDLELIKAILIKDFTKFRDRGIYNNPEDDPLSAHLFAVDGEQWRSLRNKLSPVFTSGKMKFMFPTVVAVGEHFVEACKAALEKQSDGSGVLEMKDLCARYTTDVIGSCAFGLECNSLNDPNSEFLQRGRDIFERPRHSQILQAIIISHPKLAAKFRIKLTPEETTNFFMNTVRATIDYRTKNKVRRNDFMDMLIDLKANNEKELKQHGGDIDISHGLTLEQIAAQAFVFFIAGFDTSSSTMSFALHELALNPDVQAKLREEINETLAKYDKQLTYEAINDMPYLNQVIEETLRKYSVVPHLIRKAAVDYKLPNTDIVLEQGMTIVIPVDSIQRDPEYFPDPDKFDPCRFEPEQVQQRHPCTYLPFGDGPRNCIGMRFGQMQAKIGLISLLREFKFSRCSRTEDPIELDKKNFAISPGHGVFLHLEQL